MVEPVDPGGAGAGGTGGAHAPGGAVRMRWWWAAAAALAGTAVLALVIVAPAGNGGPGANRPLQLVEPFGQMAEIAIYPSPPRPEYRLGIELPDLGTSAPAYRLIGPDLSESAMSEIARALGIDGPVVSADGGYTATGEHGHLSFGRDLAGPWYLSYYDERATAVVTPYCGVGTACETPAGGVVDSEPAVGGAGTGPDGVTNTPVAQAEGSAVPSPEEVEAIARRLLDDMGVLEGLEWRVEVDDNGGGVAVSCVEGEPCPDGSIEPTSRMARFDLVVDGVPVPDFGWQVLVGSGGLVTTVNGIFVEVERLGDLPLRSTADAFEALRRGEITGSGFWPMPDINFLPRFEGVVGAPVTPDPRPVEGEAAEPGSPPEGPWTEPALPEPLPDEPVAPPVEPTPQVSRVTGVSLSPTVVRGVEDGRAVLYLVPAYRFELVLESPELLPVERHGPYDLMVLGLAPEVVDIVEPPDAFVPIPGPLPAPAPDIVPPHDPVPSPDTVPVVPPTVLPGQEPGDVPVTEPGTVRSPP